METVWDDLPSDERATLDRAAFERHFRPHAERVIESPENAIFVAETVEGRVAGYAIVGGASSMLSQLPFGFLYDVWVAPEFRRQGVARRLVERAMEWCHTQGHTKLKLEASARNGAARALYASLGFVEERVFLGAPL